jgi:hypothetical protein
MKRDELLRHLVSFRPEAEIGVQLGNANLEISDVTVWGDGAFVALGCFETDLRDVLMEWGIPASQWEELLRGAP